MKKSKRKTKSTVFNSDKHIAMLYNIICSKTFYNIFYII